MKDFAQLNPNLISNRVRVALIGCGGNGSSMLMNLARLNFSLQKLGHPGLEVCAYDGDTVSESNIGRQSFFEPDIDAPKASTLISRLNLSFGTRWRAVDRHYTDIGYEGMLIVAVDSAKSRKVIADSLDDNAKKQHFDAPIVLDLGNSTNFGQVLIGNLDGLPSPYVQLPELIDSESENPQLPSCSTEEALRRQELFVNSMAVTLASQILWELFRKGKTQKAGFYFNLDNGKTFPVPVDSVRKQFPLDSSDS